jgi:hypothetical protein
VRTHSHCCCWKWCCCQCKQTKRDMSRSALQSDVHWSSNATLLGSTLVQNLAHSQVFLVVLAGYTFFQCMLKHSGGRTKTLTEQNCHGAQRTTTTTPSNKQCVITTHHYHAANNAKEYHHQTSNKGGVKGRTIPGAGWLEGKWVKLESGERR